MSRTGILGGSFDPPHNAHVAMARTALQKIPLDRVLLMPSPRPPHKDVARLTPYELRVRMVELAIEGEAGLELSRIETERDGPSYTVDLLEQCRQEIGNDLYFIMGADSAADLGTWKEPERLLRLATIVIFPRTGFDSVIPVRGDASVVVLDEPVIDVSSSEIRGCVARGEPFAHHLPKQLHKFILDNSLYS